MQQQLYRKFAGLLLLLCMISTSFQEKPKTITIIKLLFRWTICIQVVSPPLYILPFSMFTGVRIENRLNSLWWTENQLVHTMLDMISMTRDSNAGYVWSYFYFTSWSPPLVVVVVVVVDYISAAVLIYTLVGLVSSLEFHEKHNITLLSVVFPNYIVSVFVIVPGCWKWEENICWCVLKL